MSALLDAIELLDADVYYAYAGYDEHLAALKALAAALEPPVTFMDAIRARDKAEYEESLYNPSLDGTPTIGEAHEDVQ